MDRGNIALFAKGRKTGNSALGFIGHKDVGRWSVCSTVFTSLILVTKDAGVYLVLLKDFYVVCQDHWLQYKLCYGERESSGGNFVIYSHHSRVVTALSLLLSEPPISREMGSEHSISDTPFIWVDTEQQTQRTWGFQEVEAPRFQDSRHMKVVCLSALIVGRLYPPENIPGTNFYWSLSQPQDDSAAGRIMLMKNSSETIRNRTRDLRACSAVPQRTVATCTPK